MQGWQRIDDGEIAADWHGHLGRDRHGKMLVPRYLRRRRWSAVAAATAFHSCSIMQLAEQGVTTKNTKSGSCCYRIQIAQLET